MANHVNNFIEITFPESQRSVIESILQNVLEHDNIHCLYDNVEMTRDWYETHIGAKWARFNDEPYIDENVLTLNIESAWHEIASFVEHLNEMTQNECEIVHSFVDEAPLFAGVRVYENGEVVQEDVYEDMESVIDEEARIRSIAEGVEDTDDWRWDWMWDFVYEKITPSA